MLISLTAIAMLIGTLVAFNLVALLPVFVINFLINLKVFRPGALSYEKYEHTDSTNRTSTRSRYFFRDDQNFKTTSTGRIYLIMILICVIISEIVGLGLYFVVS